MTNFQQITIHFETSDTIPPPYSYRYTLVFRPSFQYLSAELTFVYTDREDIDADELEAEGYTMNDDFSWKGRIEKAWRDELEALLNKTKITDKAQPQNQDYLEVEVNDGSLMQKGQPSQRKDWEYLAQELLQAIFETSGKEKPFELTILKIKEETEQEAKIVGSFAKRTIILKRGNRDKYLAWEDLAYIMQTVFAHDFLTENIMSKKPNTNGLFLKFSEDGWYNVEQHIALNQLNKMQKFLEKYL